MKKEGDNGYGIVGLVLGILSIPLSLSPIFGAIFGIVGLFFSLKQKKVKANSLSKSGIILSIIGIILSIVFFVLALYIIKNRPELLAQATQVAGG